MVSQKLERVSAGEVCSIDIAKNYGFFDDNNYYKQNYRDVKTYNTNLDRNQGRDSNEVCTQTPDGKVAYPLCSLVYGIPYEQDPKDMSKCVINLKNSGFCPSTNIRDNQCKRSNLLLPTPDPIGNHCDEKLSDWYMIPNYHLGNKYNFIETGSGSTAVSSCMKPCAGDRVPGYVNDPAADGESAGIMANTKVDRCYTKDEYMSGKYSDTNNFCPIAWIYRLGQRHEDIVSDLVKEIKNTSGTNNAYYKTLVSTANQDAADIYVESKKMLENVEYTNNAMTAACSQINTPERLKKAYKICAHIKKNPKEFNDVLQNNSQKQVLKQACNALFCDESQDLANSFGKGPICINIENVVSGDDLLQNDKNINKSQNTSAVIGPEPKVNDMSSLDQLSNSSIIMLRIFISIIFITFIMILIVNFLPYIKSFFTLIRCSITGLVYEITPKSFTYNFAYATCMKPAIPPTPTS